MDVRKMPAKRLPKELVGAVMSVLKGVPVEDVLERIPKRKVAQSKGGKGCKAEYETVVKKIPDRHTEAIDTLLEAYFIPDNKVALPVETWVLENNPVSRPEYISHKGETDLIPTRGFDIRNGYVLVETDESYYSTLYFINNAGMAKRILSLNPLKTQELQIHLSLCSNDLERQELLERVANYQ